MIPPTQHVADEHPPPKYRAAELPPSQPGANELITSHPGGIELLHSQPGASELPPSHTRSTKLPPPSRHGAACRASFVPVWSHRAPPSQLGADELQKKPPGIHPTPTVSTWNRRASSVSVWSHRVPCVPAWSRRVPSSQPGAVQLPPSQLEPLNIVSQPKAAELPRSRTGNAVLPPLQPGVLEQPQSESEAWLAPSVL